MSLARVRALIVMAVLVVVAVATVAWAIFRDQASSTKAAGCATATASAATAVPQPKQVKVRVYNATDTDGLATKVANQLKKLGFQVVGTGNDSTNISSSGQVRYGPAGAGAAQLLRAYVKGSEAVQDERKDAVIDLVIGSEYAKVGLTPSNQVQAELDKLGTPTVSKPSGC